MDGTQRATVDVFVIKGVAPELRIAFTGSRSVVQSKDIYNETKVSKEILVETAQAVFEANKIIISSSLHNLKKQLDNFYEININNRSKYEWVKSHDDYVDAMMMLIYYIYEVCGMKYKIQKTDSTILSNKHPDEVTRKELHEHIDARNHALESQKTREANNEYFRKFVY